MGDRVNTFDKQGYRRFKSVYPAPEAGLKRMAYMLTENGSILRALAKSVGVREGWWRATAAASTAGRAAVSSTSDGAARYRAPVDSVVSETDLIPE